MTAVLLALLLAIVVIPYIARISPKSRQQSRWVLIVVVILFWLLAGLQPLRAQTVDYQIWYFRPSEHESRGSQAGRLARQERARLWRARAVPTRTVTR